ncbi:MAG: hypothetical protein V4608_01400 [Bacteroidota bacterium]
MEEEDGGMTLIDVITSTKEFYAELKKRWFAVIVVICISSVLGLAVAFRSKPKYIAATTMMLESSKGGGSMTGALALASQFGLMSGGTAATINEDKLLEIIKAETIIKTALFQQATIDGSTDILANHFIDLFGYKKLWEDNDSLKIFRFKNSKENLSVMENSVFKMFYGQIVQTFMKTDKSKSGIITITTTTSSEPFSKKFNEYLVNAVTSFYIDRITEKGRVNVDIVQKRVDSISGALRDAEFTLARWKDASNQLVKAQGMINEIRLRRNLEVNNSIYIEGIKQLELSKFALLEQTPFLQIIDQPAFPLKTTGRISPVKGIIIGFVLGVLLAGLYVFAGKKYADLRKSMKEQ